MSSPEVNLINHILKQGDLVTPMNAGIEKSITLYKEEWDFIKEYYINHQSPPPLSVFGDKFPNFQHIQTDGSIDYYIEEVHNWKARTTFAQLITEAASSLSVEGPRKAITNLSGELSKLSRATRQVRDLDLVACSDERLQTFRERLKLRESGRKTLGIPSGINAIDTSFGGWMKGDFIVIAGWTGSLKSWLALYMALNAWKEGYRVLYFSLEMSGEQLGYRMDTLLGDGLFSHSALTFGTPDVTYDSYKTWLGEIMRDKHPFVVVSNEDLDEVNQDTVRAKIDQWKPDLCVLDYHGLFDDASGATGEVEKTKNLSKAFKRIAIKTGCPIIDITGVTQDKKDLGESAPELADLAWSKQLAYDSDLTMGLHKNENTLHVVSRKSRRGKDFKFYLDWDVDAGKVKELGQHGIFRHNPIEEDNEGDEWAEANRASLSSSDVVN